MPFSDEERAALLAVKGVGRQVAERLDRLGVEGFADLATRDPAGLCAAVAAAIGGSCWKNSPQARAAMAGAVALARGGDAAGAGAGADAGAGAGAARSPARRSPARGGARPR